MKHLYCGDCNNYLMTSSGDMADCGCGWKQPVEVEDFSEHNELKEEVEELKTMLGWIEEQGYSFSIIHDKYGVPESSWTVKGACSLGQGSSFIEALDAAMQNSKD